MENGDKIQFAKDIAQLQAEMSYVKKQVSNHIPTAIKELDKANEEAHQYLKKEISAIQLQIARWSGAIVIILAIIQFLISKFT